MMSLAKNFFLAFLLACPCFAQSFSEICKKINTADCLEYEKNGLDFTICRWRHFYPNFLSLGLRDEEKIQQFSAASCEAWLESEASVLLPDIEGQYCIEDGQAVDLKTLSEKDPKRAYACAKYQQAQLYWQESALKKFGNISELSEASKLIFMIEQIRIDSEKASLEQEHGNLLAGTSAFPLQPSYWSTLAWRQAPLLLIGVFFVARRFWGEGEMESVIK